MKPVKPAIGFNMKGLVETIVVSLSMAEYVVDVLADLEEESGLPLTKYNIVTSIYCPEDIAYIFDENALMHTLRFSFNAEDFLLGEGEEE